MGIRKRAAENPAMALLISASTVAGAVLVLWQGVGFTDGLIVTEAEARVIHTAMDERLSEVGRKIDTQAMLNECRWLDDKIDTLDYEIYVLKRDTASPDFIRSKEQTLKKHRAKYESLLCVTRL